MANTLCGPLSQLLLWQFVISFIHFNTIGVKFGGKDGTGVRACPYNFIRDNAPSNWPTRPYLVDTIAQDTPTCKILHIKFHKFPAGNPVPCGGRPEEATLSCTVPSNCLDAVTQCPPLIFSPSSHPILSRVSILTRDIDIIIIIIIIIKNVKIRVTLSWVTLQGHFTELLK